MSEFHEEILSQTKKKDNFLKASFFGKLFEFVNMLIEMLMIAAQKSIELAL